MDQFAAEPPVQRAVTDTLTRADESLAVGESVTGGLIGALLAEAPAASDCFDRSVVAYTDEAKRDQLDIEASVLSEVGAASGVVAEEMARKVRHVAGTTWGIATTGIAGAESGNHSDQTGTVYVAIVKATTGEYKDTAVNVTQYEFDGSRAEVIEQGARQSLRNLHAVASPGEAELEFR